MSVRVAFTKASLLLVALTATLTLGACGGSSDTKAVPPTQPPTVTRVDITASSSAITTAQTAQLSAVARLSDGTSNSAPSVTWTSSAATIATVSATGLVAGVSAGTAVITGTVSGVSGTATITVSFAAGVLTTVNATIVDATVQLAQTTQAAVTGKDGFGTPVALGSRPVAWSSSNTVVATVSQNGVVTGVGVGTANIVVSVTDGGLMRTASVAIAVTGIPGAPSTVEVSMPGLTFSPLQAVVKQGGTVKFVFPSILHNVFWDPALAGSPVPPSDINDTSSATISRTFPSVGVFTYKCRLHPGMEGAVIVTP